MEDPLYLGGLMLYLRIAGWLDTLYLWGRPHINVFLCAMDTRNAKTRLCTVLVGLDSRLVSGTMLYAWEATTGHSEVAPKL